jgi:hypothetical protein
MKTQFRGKKQKTTKKQNCYAPKTKTEIGYNEHNIVIEGKVK